MRTISFFKFSLLIAFLFVFSITQASCAWFEKENEIKDEYLVKLFTPDMPYESVRVVEDSKGNRFIVVRLKEKATKEVVTKYNNLLLSRGVTIYGSFYFGYFSWQTTVSESLTIITRKVEGEPDVVEVSTSEVKDAKTGKAILSVSVKGREIRFPIDKGLGKEWKRIKIIPDKEYKIPELPVKIYPGARLREVYGLAGTGKRFRFVVKASIKDVAYHYYNQNLSGSAYWEKEVENPSRYRYPIEVFGIKTIGLYVHYIPDPKAIIRVEQSNDPNLSEYVSIEYDLYFYDDGEKRK